MPTRRLEADLILEVRAATGEGPVWDGRRGVLFWVDIPAGSLHAFDPASGRDAAASIGMPLGAVAPRSGGGLVVAAGNGFALADASDADAATLGTAALSAKRVAEAEPDRAGNRMNDGKVDPRGRFWAGSMALDLAPAAGGLYRLDPDGSVHTILTGLGISNGLDWTADGRRMYFVDSLAGGVDVFDFDADEGALSARRRAVDIPRDVGLPDGMTLDSEGALWVAIWDGGEVRRYTPDGALDTVVAVPGASQVTSCAFGGSDLADLYVTTAAAGLDEAGLREQPHSGALFVCRPGAPGRPPFAFAA